MTISIFNGGNEIASRRPIIPSGGGGGGSQTTVWATNDPGNPTYTFINTILTNSNQTMTKVGTPSNTWACRCAAINGVADTALSSKQYWEIEILSGDDWWMVGIGQHPDDTTYPGNYSGSVSMAYAPTGLIYGGAGGTESGFTTSVGDVVGCYYDHTNRKFWVTKDNISFYGDPTVSSEDPVTNVGGLSTADPNIYTWASDLLKPLCAVSGTTTTLQLRTGTNIIRTPATGFTVLP